jgi:PAS domain S-box-containing protein
LTFEAGAGTDGAAALPDEAGLFHDLLDAAPDAILIVDEAGLIVFANTQTKAMFGYEQTELLGRPVELLVPSRLRAEHRRQRARYSEEPRQRSMGSGVALAAVRKDGSELLVEISLSPHRTAGGRLLVSAAIRDISSRVRVERELREARSQAEQASTAKSRFLAAASHDLRQPLQAALLYNNVLKRQLVGSAQAETVGKLQSSLDALRDLLNRLLDISRLEAGAITPEFGVLSVRILFERMRDEFAPQALQKGIQLRMRPGEWRVRSDPQLLEQLLRNLVSNAIRYTERGRVLVGCRPAGDDLRIQVWDTGIGIASNELVSIFDEFYQVANAERSRDAGIGLGLAIVRGLSQLLGHPVTVRSAPGRGSVFEVRVPLSAPPAGRRDQATASAESRRRALIAVIEDDDQVFEGLRLSLEESGHRVIGGADLETVLHAARGLGRTPDLILSDYRLGSSVTGEEAIQRLRLELGADIPAIVVTGDSSSAALRDVRAAGFPVLHKPVDLDQLERLIAQSLAGR